MLPTLLAVHSESVTALGTKTGVTMTFGNADEANLLWETNCVTAQFKS